MRQGGAGRKKAAAVVPLNSILAGCTVCLSGISSPDKERLEDWVIRLGGTFSRDLTDATTHLIAHRVGSEKCKMQQERKGPILSPAWVNDCFDNKTRMDEANYRITLLRGFTVSLTGYDQSQGYDLSQRDEIKRLVKEHGGVFKGDLSSECTHLLCAERSGRKYNAAMQWGVAAVRKEWLFDR